MSVQPVLTGPFPEAKIDLIANHPGSPPPATGPVLTVRGAPIRIDHTHFIQDLEVKCGESAQWSDECEVTGAWPWQVVEGVGHTATRSVWVRPKEGSTREAWVLRILGDGATANEQSVTLTLPPAPQPFAGRYRGELVLASTDQQRTVTGLEPATSMTLVVDAIAKDEPSTGALLLLDPSRALSPSGRLPIPAAGQAAIRFAFLAGATQDGELVARLDGDTRTFDAATGEIAATFRVTLPLGNSSIPAPTLRGTLRLKRVSNTADPACGTGLPACPVQTTCEAVVDRCLAGPAWQASTAQPGNNLRSPAFDAWSTAVRSALGGTLPLVSATGEVTPDAAERLSCYAPNDGSWSKLDGIFGASALPSSGDLRCASKPTEPFDGARSPWHARGAFFRDANEAAGTPPSIHVGELLKQCVDQLNTPFSSPIAATSFPHNSCVSLARLFPALDIALDRTGYDRRSATLAQQLLRQWLMIHGFVAAQGEEDTRLSGFTWTPQSNQTAPLKSLATLVDTGNRGWKLLLESSVANSLTTLRPRDLRNPDYRGTNLPIMYWKGGTSTTANKDVVGTRDLVVEANSDADMSPVVLPKDVDFSGDASLAFEVSFDANRPFQLERDIVTSPWLSVRLGFSGTAYLEQGVDRIHSSFGAVAPSAQPQCPEEPCPEPEPDPDPDPEPPPPSQPPNWWECRNQCIVHPNCLAWTYDEVCGEYQVLNPPVVGTAPYRSGVIAFEQHPTVPAGFVHHFLDTRFTGGTTLQMINGSDFPTCYEKCVDRHDCRGITLLSAGQCLLMGGALTTASSLGAQAAEMPAVFLDVSHLNAQGQREAVRIPLPRWSTLRRTLQFNHKVVVVRDSATKSYRVYFNGLDGEDADSEFDLAVVSGTYAQAPGRRPGRVRVGRRDAWSSTHMPRYEAANHVALWDTTLDGLEIEAMFKRSSILRKDNALSIPQAHVADHDQVVGLPVAMIEGLTAHLKLLERQIDAVAGKAYAACNGAPASGAQAAFDDARSRLGEGLRQAVAVEQLAEAMTRRARQVECDRDSDCGSGQTCGTSNSLRQSALDPAVVRSGVDSCVAFNDGTAGGERGLGVCGSSGGSATFKFNLPATGTYTLWARVHMRTTTPLSVRVNNDTPRSWNVGLSSQSPPAWHWSRLTTGNVTLLPGEHRFTVSIPSREIFVAELVLSSDLRSGSLGPDQLANVCMKDAVPVEAELPWALHTENSKLVPGEFERAEAQLDAVEARLIEAQSSLGRCERFPYGISKLDAPLFYRIGSPGSVADRFFAASDLLMNGQTGLAKTMVDQSIVALQNATSDFNNSRTEEYQLAQDETEHQRRIEVIEKEYDAKLSQLCGAEGMLQALGGDPSNQSNQIAEDTCHVLQTSACLANVNRPVTQADPKCYAGALGEGLLAFKAASMEADLARLDLNLREDALERKGRFCAMLESDTQMILKHNEYMAKLRRKKSLFDQLSAFSGVAAAMSSLDIESIAQQFGMNILSGGLPGLHGAEFEAEGQKWEELMQLRANQQAVIACWNEATEVRGQINAATTRIEIAANGAQLALMRFSNARREVSRLVKAGNAELVREQRRFIVRPQHHYWLKEQLNVFETKFAFAKRMTYLAVHAMEHDFQESFVAERQAVLDAASPFELHKVLYGTADGPGAPGSGGLNARYSTPLVCGVQAGEESVVLRATSLAGLQPRKLGDFLRSEQAIIRDQRGNELGRGVRFTLSPTSPAIVAADSGLVNFRAERLGGIAGSVQVFGHPQSTATFRIFKRNTFTSRWCGDPPLGAGAFQESIHRPANNVFASTGGFSNLGDAADFEPITIDEFINLTDVDLQNKTTGIVHNFDGRGVYGDYMLLFNPSFPSFPNFPGVEDILIRFDYLGVNHSPGPASVPPSNQ